MLNPPADLLELAEEDASKPVSQDKLDRLKAMGLRVMQIKKEILEIKDKLEQREARLNSLVSREMPALFEESGTDRIGIPEYDIDLVMKNYYHANIAANWPLEKREAAFNYLEEQGHGDLVRVDVTVSFGKQEATEARMLAEHLRTKFGYQPTIEKTIPWNSLTAWLKEQVEKYGRVPLLEMIGATVGKTVKAEERK
jgi:uncharacterized Fe-S cluster-containing radical SAM superfamily enzyme